MVAMTTLFTNINLLITFCIDSKNLMPSLEKVSTSMRDMKPPVAIHSLLLTSSTDCMGGG
jgi:hypothetical protein